jgi:transposase
MKHYVGIDWADREHAVCILTEDDRVLSQFIIKHNWQGFQQFQENLKQLDEFEVNIERTDGLLVDWMIAQGWSVYITPPNMLARHRPRFSKDDRGDAYLLARLRRSQNEESRPLVIQSKVVEELGQLTRAYDQLVKQQTKTSNQLSQVLKAYYPSALDVFNRLTAPLTLAFLREFPDPNLAKAASRQDLYHFLRNNRYNYMSRLDKIYKHLQQPVPTARVSAGHMQHMLALVAVLETLHTQIYQLKRRIEVVFDTHPEADWWRSFPGMGPLTRASLLARIGDNRAQFPTADTLQATAGTVPVTRQSGRQKSVFFRRYCSHPLRDAAMQLARHSVNQSGWAKAYFVEQLARGHKKARAYRALANRWLRIIWTLWQRREFYDESIHLANRSRRGRPAVSLPQQEPPASQPETVLSLV